MGEGPLSSAQVRNRLILMCRRTVAQHWPGEGGECPVCEVVDCRPLAAALDYLNRVNDLSRSVVSVLMRGAALPNGQMLAGLRATVQRLAEELAQADADPDTAP